MELRCNGGACPSTGSYQARMEFRDRVVVVEPGEFIVVPRGVEHRPVAVEEVHLMLFEPLETVNTGNVQEERTRQQLDRL